MRPRYLTKSKFKLAMECPAKIFYDGKSEYVNNRLEDSFLLSLAEGGFQVGELAKCYFPGGCIIKKKEYEEALNQTRDLLKQDKIIIFESAFQFENLFVRADILIKDNNKIDMIEVKAKSFDETTESEFLNRHGSISNSWKPYLYDVAFQKYVISSAFPAYEVSAYLMMADKNASCPTDGLNQKFRVTKDETGRKSVFVSRNLSEEDLSKPILGEINVDAYCDLIYQEKIVACSKEISFIEYVKLLSDSYREDKKIVSSPSGSCSSCEYKGTDDDLKIGLKSGYQECWKENLDWGDDDFKEPTVLEIWNFKRKDKFIDDGRIKLSEIQQDDISPKSDNKPGISPSERQWLQVQKAQRGDETHWIDSVNLSEEMRRWIYPLHFIDFETSAVAIPFNKGRHPYEGIAFQFSHHIVYDNGSIAHKGQYLNTEIGTFPNYDFIRKLKFELEEDNGSIFRYAVHENTYLNLIYRQLRDDPEDIPDKEELCSFIRTITQSGKNSNERWEGSRNMIDMCELVKRYYYDPVMKGSNSIKKVLPAILNSSRFLQEKYAKPIYGAESGIESLNYENWKWIAYDEGRVKDPYKLLPAMFQDISEEEFEFLSDSCEVRDGGAALTAYARMQFEEMTDYERSEIRKALLKYCELDTLAMVMIYEGWKDLIGEA